MTTTTIYLLLIEITVLLGAISALLIHRGRKMTMNFGRKDSQQKLNPTLNELENQKLVPWGWPNHKPKRPPRTEKPDVSEAMYALMECIMMEKRLITEGDLNSSHGIHPGLHHQDIRKPDDVGKKTTTMKGKKKEPSNDSDGETVDIVDVFGRSANVRKYGHLGRVASGQSVFRKHGSELDITEFANKEILQPWGW